MNEHRRNYLTPLGWRALKEELYRLVHHERPQTVEVVNWAAGNGDRSENGDYLYGKRKLREIDRRIRYLTGRLEAAEVVDPETREPTEQIFFGATVTLAREDNPNQTVAIVGIDEMDSGQGKISWISPLAKALIGNYAGDAIEFKTPEKTETVIIKTVLYKKII